MTPTNTLKRLAWKLAPAMHRRFEEMCALAATGQLGGSQMHELDAHIATCSPCRSLLESMAQMSVKVMPLLAEERVPAFECAMPAGMRERFLSRLAASGAAAAEATEWRPYTVTEQSVVAAPRERRPNPAERKSQAPARPKSRLRAAGRLGWVAGAVAACAIAGLLGFRVGERQAVPPPTPLRAAAPPRAPLALASALRSQADRVRRLEQEKASLVTRLAGLGEEARRAETQQQALSKELVAAQTQLAALTAQSQNASQRSASTLQNASNQIAALQSRVSFLNQRVTDLEMGETAQEQTAHALQAKLETAEAGLERERQLGSTMDKLGELASSPNLHIVDVYDADATGSRKRAFGRVFYVEGKSLVFYAYDLSDRRPFQANVVFHVWGGRAGNKEVTRSLGILHEDNGGKSRWTMAFNDPTVLTEINSVFVTAEAANKHYDAPHGRKILFAFLGNPPNH